MSHISERLMRGDYIGKAECFLHSEEIQRTMAAYPPAMAAMERAQALPPCVRCDGENGYATQGHCEICKAGPFCNHCMSRHEGIDGECAESLKQ